jgi:hypothetical protein
VRFRRASGAQWKCRDEDLDGSSFFTLTQAGRKPQLRGGGQVATNASDSLLISFGGDMLISRDDIIPDEFHICSIIALSQNTRDAV